MPTPICLNNIPDVLLFSLSQEDLLPFSLSLIINWKKESSRQNLWGSLLLAKGRRHHAKPSLPSWKPQSEDSRVTVTTAATPTVKCSLGEQPLFSCHHVHFNNKKVISVFSTIFILPFLLHQRTSVLLAMSSAKNLHFAASLVDGVAPWDVSQSMDRGSRTFHEGEMVM